MGYRTFLIILNRLFPKWRNQDASITQMAFTCPKSNMKIGEQYVKSVQR